MIEILFEDSILIRYHLGKNFTEKKIEFDDIWRVIEFENGIIFVLKNMHYIFIPVLDDAEYCRVLLENCIYIFQITYASYEKIGKLECSVISGLEMSAYWLRMKLYGNNSMFVEHKHQKMRNEYHYKKNPQLYLNPEKSKVKTKDKLVAFFLRYGLWILYIIVCAFIDKKWIVFITALFSIIYGAYMIVLSKIDSNYFRLANEHEISTFLYRGRDHNGYMNNNEIWNHLKDKYVWVGSIFVVIGVVLLIISVISLIKSQGM